MEHWSSRALPQPPIAPLLYRSLALDNWTRAETTAAPGRDRPAPPGAPPRPHLGPRRGGAAPPGTAPGAAAGTVPAPRPPGAEEQRRRPPLPAVPGRPRRLH